MTSLKEKLRRFVFVPVFLTLLALGCNNPERTAVEYEDIDTSKDPVQTTYNSDEIIPIKIKEGSFNIKPVAEYKASAKVVGKESYSRGWAGKIAPVDLALAWGRLAEPENEQYVTFSQSDRWYFFQYRRDTPYPASYIINHSSNNHVIPATDNIWKAVKSVKVNKKIIIQGFLVNLTGNYEEQPVRWNTSLSRGDTGNNSCELIYVTKLRIGNEVYQ